MSIFVRLPMISHPQTPRYRFAFLWSCMLYQNAAILAPSLRTRELAYRLPGSRQHDCSALRSLSPLPRSCTPLDAISDKMHITSFVRGGEDWSSVFMVGRPKNTVINLAGLQKPYSYHVPSHSLYCEQFRTKKKAIIKWGILL